MMSRSERRFVLVDSGQRIHPDWVYETDKHVQEYLARGGKIDQVPAGMSGYDFAVSKQDRAAWCSYSSPASKVRVKTGDASAEDI
jgi:hypothetical protein